MQLRDRIKQFGYLSTMKTMLTYFFWSILKTNSYVVLVIDNHKKKVIENSVKIMTREKINNWLRDDYINDSEAKKFMKFLTSECIGYYIEVEKELAAWGFVQTTGTYQYGQYFYEIPESVHMLKNLYVKPNFRGMSLGKKINEARVKAIPDGCIPCVFVIPENKYAIRNLKLYGFQEQLKISHTTWFKKYTYTRLDLINDNKLNEIIIKGFKTL